MPNITYEGKPFSADEGETVLDCLLRHKIALANSCRAGVCQSCLVEVTEGEIPEVAQKGLKATYKKRGLILACQCRADRDLSVRQPTDAGVSVPAVLVRNEMLNETVMRLVLKPEASFVCEPGQYLTLFNAHGLGRSYSIANNPALDGEIELHVRLLPDGAMSRYLRIEAEPGTRFVLRGPAGNCFYVPDEGIDYPIVLAGTGTGLAPLVGVVKEALRRGHQGNVRLYHGALTDADLYLVDTLRQLTHMSQNFEYVPCVLNGESDRFYRQGKIDDIVLTDLPANKASTRLFACGAPDMVNGLKRRAFLSGVASRNIFTDPFMPSKAA